jgi:hypothetical protein
MAVNKKWWRVKYQEEVAARLFVTKPFLFSAEEKTGRSHVRVECNRISNAVGRLLVRQAPVLERVATREAGQPMDAAALIHNTLSLHLPLLSSRIHSLLALSLLPLCSILHFTPLLSSFASLTIYPCCP